jgi:hypothetical protein
MGFDTPEGPSGEGPRAAVAGPKLAFLGGARVINIAKAVVFLLLMIGVAPRITGILILPFFNLLGGTSTVFALLCFEAGNFAILLGACVFLSRLDGRTFGDYGLPRGTAFGQNFWLGWLLGLTEISVLIGLIAVLGGFTFGTFALRGTAILSWGLFHLVLFLFVGLYEEFLFRGYAQFTLGSGIGFWPAAILLSAVFGYLHQGNPGENGVGITSVLLIGLLFAFTLRRTGNLWYAVGLHAGFDWGETYLFSVPNSGALEPGHLSNAVLHGPAWLTGGTVGPEGSVFCFVTMGLQFLLVMWLFPAEKREPAGGTAEFDGQ